ncbi:LysR family transcriptional regulator [Celeribacter halophilus]|uniref:Transcriptional regulator, LysR family n=1 Tax=Celeribacter halophilus TaxID=576117 RepID=A0A1I3WWG4_9RHOB|nr:LysR family transcriptional regulator [Celeribacter halophilus]PZX05999.1 LysR family transcriptional regulator [Celeribacter halophilus]SFK10836.1 transcriptional regulator, LysR family [Celeribacter halophilus]
MKRFLNPNNILAFVTVAREGSVSRAAEILHLSQPAISHQIKRLSEETGVTLFRRTPHGLNLTIDGEALLPRAEQVLSAMAELRRSASTQSGQISGKLKIGTIVDPEFIRLGQLLNRLRENHPRIVSELVHGISGEILDKLKRRTIDVGFYLCSPEEIAVIPSEEPLYTKKLAHFAYRVIAPVGWESRVANASWCELAALPWIGTTPDSVHNRLLAKIFARHSVVQNSVALVDHEASMLEMVRSGVGLCLCRESIALHQRQAYGVSICETQRIPACLCILTLDAQKDTPIMTALFEQVDAIW